jgi:2-polyprenyl-3-methyl-5-hydroxy-6-metoxy-1,4-benzoquinol methylase
MAIPDQAAPPSPMAIFDAIHGYQRTAALKGALALDLFSAVASGATTVEDLAARCQASPRGVRILADYLTVVGFLAKQDGHYRLPPVAAAFLDRRSPTYLGSVAEFLAAPEEIALYDDMAATVRRGGTIAPSDGNLAAANPVWVKFARAMAPMMALPATLLAELIDRDGGGSVAKVLDIAAGHGLFGLAVARRHPTAVIHALDWPNVLAVAAENAEAAGLASRFVAISGSAFKEDFGEGYDLALLANFLHHFDPLTCESLLRKLHRSLAPGGRVAALEFIPDEDRVSPAMPAMFALVMLATTPQGDAYTFADYDPMFGAAGFARVTLHALPPTEERVIIAEK